jgi:glucose dehydrogenase
VASRRRLARLALAAALLLVPPGCQLTPPRPAGSGPPAPRAAPAHEWPTYGGTYASARYSPVDQITRDNVRQLRVAWRWRSPDHEVMARAPNVATYANEATPLMVGGILYVSTSLSQVAAIDAVTGTTLWVHDPGVWSEGTPPNHGWVHRGVAYWTDGRDERIFIGAGNAYLVALDARTGAPIEGFGAGGRVDLTRGLGRPVERRWYSVTSPPVVVRDVVVVGSSIQDFPMRRDMPPGHVRGFDARTGRQRWIFRSIPQAGEFGHETWEQESWSTPLGEGPRDHPLLAPLDLPRLGWPRRGFPLVTPTLLFVAQEGRVTGVRRSPDRPWVSIMTFESHQPTLQVFDKKTGALLAQVELPGNAQGALMTYQAQGRQYIVVPVGGSNLPAELVALSLPAVER